MSVPRFRHPWNTRIRRDETRPRLGIAAGDIPLITGLNIKGSRSIDYPKTHFPRTFPSRPRSKETRTEMIKVSFSSISFDVFTRKIVTIFFFFLTSSDYVANHIYSRYVESKLYIYIYVYIAIRNCLYEYEGILSSAAKIYLITDVLPRFCNRTY